MTPGMTWAQMRHTFIQMVGGTGAASDEAWAHLSEGYRSVASQLDVPEISGAAEITAPASQDYVEVVEFDLDLYSITHVFNKTDVVVMEPEPSGMPGRARYLQSNGKPPEGVVNFYQRSEDRLWLRDTPSAATTLMVRVRRQTPQLSDADLNDRPFLPATYDWAILNEAAANYYLSRPNENVIQGEGGQVMLLSQRHKTAAKEKLVQPIPPRVEEDRPRRRHFRLGGYGMNPRSGYGG